MQILKNLEFYLFIKKSMATGIFWKMSERKKTLVKDSKSAKKTKTVKEKDR